MSGVFARLVGQQAVEAELLAAARASRHDAAHNALAARGMSHAWLITGPPGSGRSIAALCFAAALQCGADAADGGPGCGRCRACTTAMAGTHADVRRIVPEGLSIGVDEMRAIVQMASRRPGTGRWQIVVVEDADRLTEGAGNALLKVVEEPPPSTVFLLCAPSVDPEDIAITLRSRCRHVALVTPPPAAIAQVLIDADGLDRETAEWAAAVSGGQTSANFVEALHKRTEGHPLFLKETLRYLIDAKAPQAFDAASDPAQWLTKIPTGVREVIGKRLNRLSVPAARYLSIAACIGRVFDMHLLAQLEADKSEDELLQALQEALDEHLIEVASEPQQLRFGHALIRETLYDEILGLRRSRLHLRIGEMLEQHHGTDDPNSWPQLAYHFGEARPGGSAVKALDYAKRAAAHAAGLLAFEEAARLYRLALQLLQRHFGADFAQRCAVLLALADAQTWFDAPE